MGRCYGSNGGERPAKVGRGDGNHEETISGDASRDSEMAARQGGWLAPPQTAASV